MPHLFTQYVKNILIYSRYSLGENDFAGLRLNVLTVFGLPEVKRSFQEPDSAFGICGE
jgi:hypothetical protein